MASIRWRTSYYIIPTTSSWLDCILTWGLFPTWLTSTPISRLTCMELRDHIVLTLQPQFCFVLRFLCRLCMRRLLWHDLFHCPLTRTMLVHTLIVLPSFLTGLLLLYKCVMIEPILSALPPSSLSLIPACTISTSRL